MAKEIPVLGWFQTSKLVLKNRNFLPGFQVDLRNQFGEIVQYNLSGKKYSISKPELAQKIMRVDFRKMHKTREYDELRPYHGNGMLMSEGDDWVKQRRWSAPFFLRSNYPAYLKIIAEETNEIAKKWSSIAASNQGINIVPDLNSVTFKVLCRAIMGEGVDEYLDELYAEINESLYLVPKRTMTPVKTPFWLPTPLNLKIRASAKRYRGTVQKIIDRARVSKNSGLLGHLLKQQDITHAELLDMVSIMIAAGFETTANLLSWTLGSLAKYKDTQDKFRKELEVVDATEGPTLEQLEGFDFLEAVINENLRLYPPALWPMRKCEEKLELEGYVFEKGSTFDLATWPIHRHPDYWEDPDAFRPERFLKENITEKNLQAFFPFAVGPRECVGKQFALLEARVILCTLVKRFRLELVPGAELVPDNALIMRPKYGVQVRLSEVRQPVRRRLLEPSAPLN